MSDARSIRATIGLTVLVGVLTVGAWMLGRGQLDPTLEPATGPPSPTTTGTPAPAPPATVTPTPVPPAPTPPVPAPPTPAPQPGGPDGDHPGPDQPPLEIGGLRIRLTLPRTGAGQPPRTALFIEVGPDGRLGNERRFGIAPADGVAVLEVRPLVVGRREFVIDIPGLASGGPFAAEVIAGRTMEVGPFVLESLGTLVWHFDPPASPTQPVLVQLTATAAATNALRQRIGLCTEAATTWGQLAPGRYRAVCRAAGRGVVVVDDLEVRAGGETERQIALPPEARCEVRVVDAGGNPPPLLYLRLRFAGGYELADQPDARQRAALRPLTLMGGRIRLGELPAGRLELLAATSLGGPWTSLGDLVVEPGDNAPAAFTWRG